MKEELNEAFYKKDGNYHTNIFEVANFEKEEDEIAVYQTVYDMLDEGEIRFIYDDSTIDHSTAFLVYRNKNRLIMEYIFLEGEHFILPIKGCIWIYPTFDSMRIHEQAEFSLKLDEYVKAQELNLKIDGFKKNNPRHLIQQSEKDQIIFDDKQVKNVIILAYVARYGTLATILLGGFMGLVLFQRQEGFLLAMSIGMIIFAGYLFIGSMLQFRHIYCMLQNANHQVMTPNEVYWNTIKKSDKYGVPLILFVIGLIGFVYSIITLY